VRKGQSTAASPQTCIKRARASVPRPVLSSAATPSAPASSSSDFEQREESTACTLTPACAASHAGRSAKGCGARGRPAEAAP
jgi:hypothetical protein